MQRTQLNEEGPPSFYVEMIARARNPSFTYKYMKQRKQHRTNTHARTHTHTMRTCKRLSGTTSHKEHVCVCVLVFAQHSLFVHFSLNLNQITLLYVVVLHEPKTE